MSSKELVISAILQVFQHGQNRKGFSSTEISSQTGISPATLKRHLDALVRAGRLRRIGQARATRYHGLMTPPENSPAAESGDSGSVRFAISEHSRDLLAVLGQSLATRRPVSYQREFVEQYTPNETFLLPKALADSLLKEGKMTGQQPAGTYARRVLEQLLIELSWSSSRLEGNRFTLLATEDLFARGVEGGDADAVMLLNHKRAIEFLVDAVPENGLTTQIVRNLHSLLMQDLLTDPTALGAIRSKIVNISDTVYIPSQVSPLLEEMLERIIGIARQIKNSIEASFFLWINIAYLQPFEDGNKSTSRLTANIPLIIDNCAPLSFMHVEIQEYATAMIGVYELLDPSFAVDLFTWCYRRSIQRYAATLESLGRPDPFRLKYREILSTAVQNVVQDRQSASAIMQLLNLPSADELKFATMLGSELSILTTHNCARHRLSSNAVDQWIARGRPGST